MSATAARSTDAPAPAATPPPRRWPLDRPDVRARIGLLAAVFCAVHAEILFRLGWIAWTDGDWSHAFLIPLIAAYFVHQRRERLAAVDYRACWPGLAVVVVALIAYGVGLRLGHDTLKGYAAIANLFGLVLLIAGPGAIRVLWLPILYLAFAVKLPDALWSQIAWQLQLLAAKTSVVALMVLGVDAHVTTTTIELWHGGESLGSLNVAEACSGMRMLMTFAALGVAVAYLSDRSWWARLILLLSALPIAIAVNVGRVTLLGLLYLIDPELAQGDFHLFMGMLMLIPALALFVFVGWLVNLLDEPHDGATGDADASGAAPPRSASTSGPATEGDRR